MAKASKTGTVIAKQASERKRKGQLISVENYEIIADPDKLEVLQCNLEGETLSEFDLDQIHVPGSGGTVFEVPGLNGPTNEEEVTGVVLAILIRRGFWENTIPDGSPPDCSSSDGIIGIGNPGGPCDACEHNQFGTAIGDNGKPGKGKRCREMRAILFLREGDTLPVVVCAPPTSLKGFKRYLMKLPVAMHTAVTTINLEKVATKPPYSIIVPRYDGHISPEHGRTMKSYAAMMKQTIGKSPSPLASSFSAEPDFQQSAGSPSDYGVDNDFIGPDGELSKNGD